MANVATKKKASRQRLTYEIVGDGTVALVLDNARLLADMVEGPLKDLFNAVYADQAAMRAALLEESAKFEIRKRTRVGAPISDWAADVDVDAVTAAKPEINVQAPDANGSVIYLDIQMRHSLND